METMNKRKILITNDDGIMADGLLRLSKSAIRHGDVWVVAPDSQRSAMSHSVSFRDSFEAWQVDFPVKGVTAYACSGTPADCVRIGMLNIVPGGADCVFSGINYGYNAASDLQYSATVGAAFEAAFQGAHSIAFSEHAIDLHEVTDRYLDEIMDELIDMPLNENQIWNVNFPGCTLDECRGIQRNCTVSGDVFYQDRYKVTPISEGRASYMVDGIRKWEAGVGTDLRAILDSYISIGIATNIS